MLRLTAFFSRLGIVPVLLRFRNDEGDSASRLSQIGSPATPPCHGKLVFEVGLHTIFVATLTYLEKILRKLIVSVHHTQPPRIRQSVLPISRAPGHAREMPMTLRTCGHHGLCNRNRRHQVGNPRIISRMAFRPVLFSIARTIFPDRVSRTRKSIELSPETAPERRGRNADLSFCSNNQIRMLYLYVLPPPVKDGGLGNVIAPNRARHPPTDVAEKPSPYPHVFGELQSRQKPLTFSLFQSEGCPSNASRSHFLEHLSQRKQW